MKRILAAVGLVGAMLFAPTVASAGALDDIGVTPNPVPAGGVITVSGAECRDYGDPIVEVFLEGDSVGTVVPEADETWALEVDVPGDYLPGDTFQISAECDTGDGTILYNAAFVTVGEATAPTSAVVPTTPTTTSDVAAVAASPNYTG